jgi:phenylacetic acid degradation operon negative regulatory protein
LWDGKWRVVVFSVSEHDRKCKNLFVGKLDELKFKKIFKGVYIAPHPVLSIVSKYANELGLRQKCVLFETDKIDQETKTIQRIWNIDEINKKYGQFIELASNKLANINEYWALMAKEVEKVFISIYNEDAHLPAEFLPKNWQGDEAYRLFKKISNSYKVSK